MVNKLEDRNELTFFTKHIRNRYFWQSLFSRRSRCDNCGKVLRSFELFPIFSFLLQRGRCTNCKSVIDSSHLWVEIVCGVYFMGIFHTLFWQHQVFDGEFMLNTLFWLLLFGTLFVLALFDYRTKLIPDILLLFAGLLALLRMLTIFDINMLLQHLAAGLLFAALFYSLWFATAGKGIGFADGKLALIIGLVLGLSAGFTALAYAFWVGAAVGVLLVILGKITNTSTGWGMKSAIPFGPFMVLGLWLVFVTQTNMFSLI